MTTPPRCCGLGEELRIWLARRVGLSSGPSDVASLRTVGFYTRAAKRRLGACGTCSFQGLGKVQKENARKGLLFFFPLLVYPSLLGKGTAPYGREMVFSFPQHHRLLSLSPAGRPDLAPCFTKACAGSHMSLHLRRIAVFLISSPALTVASEKLAALSGFKWLLHNPGCQAG